MKQRRRYARLRRD